MKRAALVAIAEVVAGAWMAAVAPAVGAGGATAADAASAQTSAQSYVVVYGAGVSSADGRAAVEAAGGVVVEENTAVGIAVATSANPAFAARSAAPGSRLVGAARNRPIGELSPNARVERDRSERAQLADDLATATAPAAPAGPAISATLATSATSDAESGDTKAEPLGARQWDMAMIGVGPDGSYKRSMGKPGVLVGVIDTGIDGSHPDLAPNFDAADSRNFTTDIPAIDGPCEAEADHSCSDPADVDEDGHGTHVAGTIAAAYDGAGISGVAPKVTLVNLRAGQDSGYFFVKPVVDALTYAGDIGVDVVNMSFFVDPWLYNCASNPADSAAERNEQRTIVAAVQRALDYARARGVTAIAALGNSHTDLGNPTVDAGSPDFPPDAAKTRTVDDSCLSVPAELNGVLSVSAVGPSGRKADYSDYGISQNDLTAPGGFLRDGFGTPSYRSVANLVLSTTPAAVVKANGDVDAAGLPINPQVVRSCDGGRCAYYRYEQGTSMAAPHVAGVAALIVSKFGHRDDQHPGLTLGPDVVDRVMLRTARDLPCPASGFESYANEGRSIDYDAVCVGNDAVNGLAGEGLVDANAALLRGRSFVED